MKMDCDIQSTIQAILFKTLPNNVKINNITIETNPTTGGYSCKIVSVSVDLLHLETNNKESVTLVMKYLPEETKDDTLKQSFTKEVLMYKIVIPEYIRIQKELNIDQHLQLDIFPDFFESNTTQINDGSNISAFLMNDLRTDGYISSELINELDLEHTKLVIDGIAYFHAIGIKLKEIRPELYNNSFKELLKPALRNVNNPRKNEIDCEFIERIHTILRNNMKLSRFTVKVINLIENINAVPLPNAKEPFATILHNDLWKNNLLFKYESGESSQQVKPLCVKFIDFQFLIYNSPIRDLIYFVFTSTTNDIQKNFQRISAYYYERFIHYLTLLTYKNINQFNMDTYNEEMDRVAWTKFKHILSTILVTNKDNSDNSIQEKLFNLFTCFESNGWL